MDWVLSRPSSPTTPSPFFIRGIFSFVWCWVGGMQDERIGGGGIGERGEGIGGLGREGGEGIS